MYNKHPSKSKINESDTHWIIRLKVKDDVTGLEIYNQKSNSIILIDELPMLLIEYDQDKLFVTSFPTHMFLVIEWETVIEIEDPNFANTDKTFAFELPGFNIDSFPFLAVCGQESLSILNVNN